MAKFNDRDLLNKKRKSKKDREKKIHRVAAENRSMIKQDLRKLAHGIITDEEFELAHGDDEDEII